MSALRSKADVQAHPSLGSVLSSPEEPTTRLLSSRRGLELAQIGGRNDWLPAAESVSRSCPLWVISGRTDKTAACPLYPQERTLGGTSKSAFGYRFMSTRPKLVLNRPDRDREMTARSGSTQGDKRLKKADREPGGPPRGSSHEGGTARGVVEL